MTTIEALIDELNSFKPIDDYRAKCAALATEIERRQDGADAVDAVLQLFEKFQDVDFGMPGPLAHAIETFYGRGYEEKLLSSIRHRPTRLTLWLANRIANAHDSNSPIFVSLLRATAERKDIPEDVSREARHFAELHD